MAPYIAQVHNFSNASDAKAPVADEFGVAVLRLPAGDSQVFVNWMGQELDDPAEVLLDELKRGDPRSREYGVHAAGVMVEIVRTVAASNEFVGRDLLINALPRWAIHPGQAETVLIAGGPVDEEPTFLHLPHDQDNTVTWGPRYVCEGRQMANFQAWTPGEDEIASMRDSAEPS